MANVAIALIAKAPEILTALAVLVTAVVGLKSLKQSKIAAVASTEAATKVEEVRITAAETKFEVATTLAGIVKSTDATHILVNNAMSIQLKANAVLARRIAAMSRDPIDIGVADEAEQKFAEHVRKQAIVDEQIAKDAKGAK